MTTPSPTWKREFAESPSRKIIARGGKCSSRPSGAAPESSAVQSFGALRDANSNACGPRASRIAKSPTDAFTISSAGGAKPEVLLVGPQIAGPDAEARESAPYRQRDRASGSP